MTQGLWKMFKYKTDFLLFQNFLGWWFRLIFHLFVLVQVLLRVDDEEDIPPKENATCHKNCEDAEGAAKKPPTGGRYGGSGTDDAPRLTPEGFIARVHGLSVSHQLQRRPV